jgi:hypothetical protein
VFLRMWSHPNPTATQRSETFVRTTSSDIAASVITRGQKMAQRLKYFPKMCPQTALIRLSASMTSLSSANAFAPRSSDADSAEAQEIERVKAFVTHAAVDEVVHHIVRSEQRLRELDERLRHVKLIVDGAKL